eukprot:TRINITY_DN4782_c0_g2_i1.p1 TRINITY_DN4782_c0_g2~~TRINITY_DN4782_c0_g2_i1.p1  ORF type:complete len:495 (+),score=102.56 TRINITY_DN4782_c0_g2_i1:417-1901(+)
MVLPLNSMLQRWKQWYQRRVRETKMFLHVGLILSFFFFDVHTYTTNEYYMTTTYLTAVRQLITAQLALNSTSLNPCSSESCVPKLVRLGFHMSLPVDGVQGCLNLGQSENNGLSSICELLESIFQSSSFTFSSTSTTGGWVPDLLQGILPISNFMSRADFWVLAATEALVQGARLQPSTSSSYPTFTFKWGRKDCDSSTYNYTTVTTYPDGLSSCESNFYVMSKYGFTIEQYVATLGAHGMGSASPSNSGFSLKWRTNTPGSFDNVFFTALVTGSDTSYPWYRYLNRAYSTTTTTTTSTSSSNLITKTTTKTSYYKWQWRQDCDSNGHGPWLLLASDFCLAYPFTTYTNQSLTSISTSTSSRTFITVSNDIYEGEVSCDVLDTSVTSSTGCPLSDSLTSQRSGLNCYPEALGSFGTGTAATYASYVTTFANSNSYFYTKFAEAWTLMMDQATAFTSGSIPSNFCTVTTSLTDARTKTISTTFSCTDGTTTTSTF